MKKITFLTITITCLMFSCKKNDNETLDNKSKITNDNSEKIQDSIKKAEELVLQQSRQDSIEETRIKGYSIKKISGKHKYGGVTKIEYKNLSQLLLDESKQAAKEMLTEDEEQSRIRAIKVGCAGGQIRLDIERSTISSANFEEFSIIVKDLNEKELYRVDLDSDIPETPNSNDNWWNIHLQDIETKIKVPFYVYIVDRLEDAPFKFEVTPIMK